MTPVLRAGRYPAYVLLAALTACGPEARPADTTAARRDSAPPVQVLVAVPVLPGAKAIAATGTTEAVSTTIRSAMTPDAAATWYRRALLAGGWRLISDQRANDGALTIHAEREGPPVWIFVRPGPGGRGSDLQVIGAVVDTTSAPPAQPARPAKQPTKKKG